MPSDVDLRFGPGPSPVGFTPAGIAAFDDLRPAAVVRELIQNSLDAAVAAGEPTAIVRFRLWTCDAGEVPGLEAYMRAFSEAIDFHRRQGPLPSKADRVVGTIEQALQPDDLKILSVLDNGVGLDERRMTALLSDGVSAKDASSAGTYGNGHSVAIPASDLRYALYGGLTANGQKIAAGHAVLASHVGGHPGFPSSGDGFLVRGFRNGRDGALFDFARGDDVPPLIRRELDDISQMSDHGTAVILPAFNSFRERRRSVADLVLEAAACNFFVAVQEERLEVRVEDADSGGPDLMLGASTLADTLDKHRERKRSRAFLSGARAYDAHRAFRFGRREVVRTSQGDVEVRLCEGAETTRIDLCRNGMWITHDKSIAAFRAKFTDRVPFHAVLVLDAERGGRLHKLVRDAEGPLHDTIRLKDLSRDDRRDLTAALGEIREWILANTRKVDGDSFGVDDYLALDFGDGERSGGSDGTAYRGMPRVVKQRVATWHSSSTGGIRSKPKRGSGSGSKDRTRPGRSTVLNSAFQAISVPVRRHRRRIRVMCSKACDDAVLRLRVNENVDATCDSLWYEVVPAILEDVRIGGRRAEAERLVHRRIARQKQEPEGNTDDSAEVVGVRLGPLAAGASVEIETSYRVPGVFGSWRGAEPSLAVEVVEGGFGDPDSGDPGSGYEDAAEVADAAEDGQGEP